MEIQANREHERALTGLEKIRSILSSREGSFVPTVLFDLDDTIKEKEAVSWGDGRMRRIYPETVTALSTFRDAGIQLGIATEQAVSEVIPFLSEISSFLTDEDWATVFNGPIIAEGGSIILERTPEGNVSRKLNIEAYLKPRDDMKGWLDENLPGREWSVLPGVDSELGTLVMMPPTDEQGEVSISIFEQGEHTGVDPSYIKRYSVNRERIISALEELKINNLDVFEAGNGTIRIVPEKRSKANTMRLLNIAGGISLKDTVFFCDGPNDITLAQLIKSKGGGVVAVGNAVGELHEIADYSAILPAGRGVAQAVHHIFQAQLDQ